MVKQPKNTTAHTRRQVLSTVAGGGFIGLAGCNTGEESTDDGEEIPEDVPQQVQTKVIHQKDQEANNPRFDDLSPEALEEGSALTKTAEPGKRIGDMPILFEPSNVGWADLHAFMVEDGSRQIGLETTVDSLAYDRFLTQLFVDPGNPGAVCFIQRGQNPRDGADIAAEAALNMCGRFPHHYCNPEYDEAARGVLTKTDEDARMEDVNRVQEIFVNDYVSMVTVFPPLYNIVNTDTFEGYVVSPGDGVTQDNSPWTAVNVQPKSDRDVFIIGFINRLPQLNVHWGDGASTEFRIIINVYSSLSKLSPDLELVPDLATNWEIDETSAVIELRDGVTWHDGEPFGPEDVKFAVENSLANSPDLMSHMSYALENISQDNSVEILSNTGGGTVRINLEAPDPTINSVGALTFYPYPKHIWEEVENPVEYRPDNPIGTGPFKFVSWEPGSRLVLESHDDHWFWDDEYRSEVLGDQFVSGGGITELRYVDVGGLDATVGAVKAGDIDTHAFPFAPGTARDEGEAGSVEALAGPAFQPMYGWVNHTLPPCRDKEFRKAWMKHSLDIEGFNDDVLLGEGSVGKGHNFVFPDHRLFNEDVPENEYNINKARQILKEAGYTWDSEGRIQYPDGEAWAGFVERTENPYQSREDLGQPSFA